MIVPIALALARLRRVNPAVAEAVARDRARQARAEQGRPRTDVFPRLYRPGAASL